MVKHAQDMRGLSDDRTIEVPLEAFALLMAYSMTRSPDVPAHIKAHPAWPERHDGKKGHLRAAFAPYAQKAFRMMKDGK